MTSTLPELPREVLDRLKAKLQTEDDRRKGVHVSDLVFPRRAWLKRRAPAAMTDDEALYFIAGRAHHALVESLLGEGTVTEKEVTWRGITGTVDALCLDRWGSWKNAAVGQLRGVLGLAPASIVVEFKTTRGPREYTTHDVPPHYLQQLGMYVAMTSPEDVTYGQGVLLVLHLAVKVSTVDLKGRNWRSVPRLIAFRSVYDNLDYIRGDMLFRKTMVEGPVEPPEHLCPSWLCRTCTYHKNGCEGRKEDG